MTLIRNGLIGAIGGGGTSASQLARSDGLACFTQSFTSVTTTSFTHGLGSTDVIVEFQDAAGDLLVPDNWTAVNNNVLSVEFSGSTTGRVVIIACIASGLAPVTGGVTSIEGLSGIVDLDCPDGSTIISTSGQVITICSIFTPASGALLESLQTGGAGGGVTQLNGISGIINLTSPDESVNVFVNGQAIELTTPTSGAPSGASYLLREYNDNGHLTTARILSATSGIRLIDRGARSGSGLVATLDFDDEPTVNQVLSWNGSMLEWVNQTGGGGGEIDTQTSINGLSGTLFLTSPDGTILIGDGPQSLELSGLFTQASGAVLEQKCRDLNTLSGIAVSTSGVVRQTIDERRQQGVVSGLEISINAGNSGLFDVASGVAYVSGIRIAFNEELGIDPGFPPGSGDGCNVRFTYICLGHNGNIFLRQGAIPDHGTLAQAIDLGFVRAADPTGPSSGFIDTLHTENFNILNRDYNEASWANFAVGAVVASGVIASDNGGLTVSLSEGIFYDRQQNRHTHDDETPINFNEIYRGGDGNYRIQSAGVTVVNNTQYDSGFGLVNITGNRFVMHSLWLDVVEEGDDEHFLVISNDEHNSLQLAQDAPINPGCLLDASNIIPIAKIIIRRNATLFSGSTGRIVDVRPIIGARGAGGTLTTSATTLQQAYDNSTDVEIVLDNIRDGLDIHDNVTTPLVDSGKTLFHVHAADGIVAYIDVHGSGVHIPSGTVEDRLGIVMPRGAQPRCPLDVSGLICASGLEIVGSRPIVSGIGVATLADVFDAGQTSINGVSGAVTLDSPDESVNINVNGQSVELTTPGSGAPSGASYLLREYNDNDHLTTARVLSATSGIRLLDRGARSGSGLVITLDFQDQPFASDLLSWNGSGLEWVPISDTQTVINGLSGAVTLATTNSSIAITEIGQTINLDAIFTWGSGQILEQKCRDIITLSGLILPDGGQTSINGISGLTTLDSPDESININVNGQSIEVTTPTSGAPSGASYLLQEYNDNGHLTDARVLSATSGVRLDDQGARSGSGMVITLDFDDEPTVGQAFVWGGQKGEWTTVGGGGGLNKMTSTFTSSSGLEIIVEHALGTEDWTWSMWRTDGDLVDEILLPDNVYPSGVDHAVIVFTSSDSDPSGYNGKVVFVG